MGGARLFIGELAKEVGLAPSALRYYEAAGLLEAEERTDTGYRVYNWRAADRLRFIQRAKAVGLRLSEIKRLVDSPRRTPADELAFFNRFLASKIKETQSQIASLQATARHLRQIEATLTANPPQDCCHVGDCSCWLPMSSVPRRRAS